MPGFNVTDFVRGIFRPEEGERFLFMVDGSNPKRNGVVLKWAAELERGLEECNVLPVLYHEATRENGAPLPEMARFYGETEDVSLAGVLRKVDMVWSLPGHSATRPLFRRIQEGYDFRCASSPGFQLDMLETVMTEPPEDIQERGRILRPMLDEAVGIHIEFENDDSLYFDKRGVPLEDDLGILHKPHSLGNVPFGEICFPQHEGSLLERLIGTDSAAATALEKYYAGLNANGEAHVQLREADGTVIMTETSGRMPVRYGKDLVVYVIRNGFVVDVEGNNEPAENFRRKLERIPLAGYIAEGAPGLNSRARADAKETVEREKAGFHIATGNAAQVGGYPTPLPPQEDYHDDKVLVDPKIRVAKLVYAGGQMETIMADGRYVIFGSLNFPSIA